MYHAWYIVEIDQGLKNTIPTIHVNISSVAELYTLLMCRIMTQNRRILTKNYNCTQIKLHMQAQKLLAVFSAFEHFLY